MTASDGFIELLKDALNALGPVRVRRMFGGAGVYADGVMFALVADDALFLKADATTRAAHEAEGLTPFVYRAKGQSVALGYWRAPDRLLDDPDEMVEWARRALAVARRSATAKTRSSKANRAGSSGSAKRERRPAGKRKS